MPGCRGPRKTVEEIVDLVGAVADSIDAIALTSGVAISVEEEEEDVCRVVAALGRFGLPIGVSIYPTPSTPNRLAALGVAEVKFNLEAATPDLFAVFCPGLSYATVWDALVASVPLFGRGHVFSNVIVGLGETDEELDTCVDRLVGIGVVPVLRPLNPVAGCRDLARPSAERLARAARNLSDALDGGRARPVRGPEHVRRLHGLRPRGMEGPVNAETALVAALRAAADHWYGVPGYPVTGIAAGLGAHLPANEKVGLEHCLGHSLSGRRSGLVCKHVGLNACADPLVQATTRRTLGRSRGRGRRRRDRALVREHAGLALLRRTRRGAGPRAGRRGRRGRGRGGLPGLGGGIARRTPARDPGAPRVRDRSGTTVRGAEPVTLSGHRPDHEGAAPHAPAGVPATSSAGLPNRD